MWRQQKREGLDDKGENVRVSIENASLTGVAAVFACGTFRLRIAQRVTGFACLLGKAGQHVKVHVY
jgi:hypothetical protein